MKRIISIFMCLLMLFSMTVFAAAQPNLNNKPDFIENYDGYPIIVVRGFNFSGMYNEKTGEKAFSLTAKTVLKLISNVCINSLIFRNENALADGIVDFLWDSMGNFASDEKGNSINPDITIHQSYNAMSEDLEFLENVPYKNAEGVLHEVVDAVGAENVYFLNLDWRLAPWESAGRLNNLVESAKKNSCKDKVKIICASMGGAVTTAYLKYYGGKSVDSCTFLSSAHNGAGVAGEALNGTIVIPSESFKYFFTTMAEDNGNYLLAFILKALGYTGVYGHLANVVNNFAEKSLDKIYDEALIDIFATNLGLWSLCPDALYDSAVENIFSGRREEYSELLEKVMKCREFVFTTEETLAKAEQDGVKMTFVSNYDSGLLPIYKNSAEQGDRFLELRLTSGFATVANADEILGNDYIEKADKKYISPDRVIDAGKCLYKDRTWFIKNATHVAADYGTEYSEFVLLLALSQEQPTIDTFPQYPQFLISDRSMNLQPLKVNDA